MPRRKTGKRSHTFKTLVKLTLEWESHLRRRNRHLMDVPTMKAYVAEVIEYINTMHDAYGLFVSSPLVVVKTGTPLSNGLTNSFRLKVKVIDPERVKAYGKVTLRSITKQIADHVNHAYRAGGSPDPELPVGEAVEGSFKLRPTKPPTAAERETDRKEAEAAAERGVRQQQERRAAAAAAIPLWDDGEVDDAHDAQTWWEDMQEAFEARNPKLTAFISSRKHAIVFGSPREREVAYQEIGQAINEWRKHDASAEDLTLVDDYDALLPYNVPEELSERRQT